MSRRSYAHERAAERRRAEFITRSEVNADERAATMLYDAARDEFRPAEPGEAVELLCALQSLVSRSGVTLFPSVGADCFCGQKQMTRFENAGQSLGYIVRAVIDALIDDTDGGES